MQTNGLLTFITQRYNEAKTQQEKDELSQLYWIAADNHLKDIAGETISKVEGMHLVPIKK